MVKQRFCTHPVKAGTCSVQWLIWNLLSAVTVFEFLVIHAVQFLQGDEGRIGKKSLSTGAEDGRVAFSLRKRSLTDGKPLRLPREFEKAYGSSKISKAFYSCNFLS